MLAAFWGPAAFCPPHYTPCQAFVTTHHTSPPNPSPTHFLPHHPHSPRFPLLYTHLPLPPLPPFPLLYRRLPTATSSVPAGGLASWRGPLACGMRCSPWACPSRTTYSSHCCNPLRVGARVVVVVRRVRRGLRGGEGRNLQCLLCGVASKVARRRARGCGLAYGAGESQAAHCMACAGCPAARLLSCLATSTTSPLLVVLPCLPTCLPTCLPACLPACLQMPGSCGRCGSCLTRSARQATQPMSLPMPGSSTAIDTCHR